MTPSAGRIRGISKFHGSGRAGSGSLWFKTSRVGPGRVGSGQELSKSRGSGRAGSRGIKISRSGQVGSRVLKTSRVGLGHDPRAGHSRLKPPRPAGCVWRTRVSKPRIWPADSPFSNLHMPVGGHFCVSAPRGSDPRIWPADSPFQTYICVSEGTSACRRPAGRTCGSCPRVPT